ncbi:MULTISPECIES: hypothetical protein [Paenibacillus]|uniref:hypothetical protein n=1 Tax=Paenibacillus TaxID=44249 RepID=UPI00129E2AB4|nr:MULTISPECIES: hypothetical protein [Paenibacillus]MBE7678908.1 hypothetical protein [Paenibacillus sp. P13VS]MCM3202946.1 hypothetical protein [Paenibacillus illinoisensis]
MTLSKKRSRRILINEETFRWGISPDSGYMVFVAEHEFIQGRKLEVYVDNMTMKIIQPRHVRRFIVQAIEAGWEYKLAGKPTVFDLKNDRIIVR